MSKDSTQRPRPDSNRGPFDPKSDAVTDWPLRRHLEQLNAQSSLLFPIIFSIILIPFFNICSALAVLLPGLFGYVLLHLGHCAVATVAVRGFGSWSLVFHWGAATSNLPSSPTPSQTAVCSTMGESIRPSRPTLLHCASTSVHKCTR